MIPLWALSAFGFLRGLPSWVWKLVAVVVALVSIYSAGYIRGKNVAELRCEQRAQQAQKAADKQDLQAEKEGREQDLQITEALTQQKKVDDARIAQLEAQLRQRVPSGKTDPCLYDKNNADPDDPPTRRVR